MQCLLLRNKQRIFRMKLEFSPGRRGSMPPFHIHMEFIQRHHVSIHDIGCGTISGPWNHV